eukprot:4869253-Prymnesium_polylepis.1
MPGSACDVRRQDLHAEEVQVQLLATSACIECNPLANGLPPRQHTRRRPLTKDSCGRQPSACRHEHCPLAQRKGCVRGAGVMEATVDGRRSL